MPPPRHSDMGERGVMVGLAEQQGNVVQAARNPLVHYSQRTVQRWNDRFQEEGYDGLRTRQRSGRPKIMTEEELMNLRALAMANPLLHLKDIVREHMPHLVDHMRAVYQR